MSRQDIENQVAERVSLYSDLVKNWGKLQPGLSNCYGQLSNALLCGAGDQVITNNKETYSVLLNWDILLYISYCIKGGAFTYDKELYPKLLELFNNKSQSNIANLLPKLSKDISIVGSVHSADEVLSAVKMFGLEKIDEDAPDDEAMAVEQALEQQGLFDDILQDNQEVAQTVQGQRNSQTNEHPHDRPNNSVDVNRKVIGDSDPSELIDERDVMEHLPDIDPSSWRESAHGDIDDGAGDDDAEPDSEVTSIVEKYDEVFGGLVNMSTSKLVRRFAQLYSSGYSGIYKEPWGILSNEGVIKAYSSKKFIGLRPSHNDNNAEGSDIAFDSALYEIVQSILKDMLGGSHMAIEEMGDNYRDIYEFHAKICFGYFRTADGLRKFAKEHPNLCKGIDPSKATRAGNYKLVEKYALTKVKEIIYKRYAVAIGEPNPRDTNQRHIAQRINNEIVDMLSSVIVVPKFNKGEQEELRISTVKPLDPKTFANRLQDELGQVVDIIEYRDGVLSVKIVYDVNSKNKDLFAKDTLDGILATGEPIRWDHALLGECLNGQPLFWDKFKEPPPSDRVYCIYAESRAGKGVMTSTLVCNALSNGYKVVYMDGKPENSVGLGKIAWSKGREAAVYNGDDRRMAPYVKQLEAYTNNIRSVKDPFIGAKYIPKGIFESASTKREFMNIATYIRGLELAVRLIEYRATLATMDDDDWLVFIFDEIQAIAAKEQRCQSILKSFLSSRFKVKVGAGFRLEMPKGADEAVQSDPAGKFAVNWFKWLAQLSNLFVSAATRSIGKSNTNLFFIFQGTKWIKEASADSFITNSVIKVLGDCSTKIIGNQAIAGAGGDSRFGDGNAAGFEWVKTLNANRGTWAITHSSVVSGCKDDDTVTLFRPFVVWLEPIVKSLPNGQPLTPENIEKEKVRILTAPSSIDKSGEKFRYLEPYLTKMMEAVRPGLEPAQVIEDGWIYADKFIKENNFGTNLNQFMYNTYDFSVTLGNEEDDILENGADDGTEESGAPGQNSFDIGGSDAPETTDMEAYQESENYTSFDEEPTEWFTPGPSDSEEYNNSDDGGYVEDDEGQNTSDTDDWFEPMYSGGSHEIDEDEVGRYEDGAPYYQQGSQSQPNPLGEWEESQEFPETSDDRSEYDLTKRGQSGYTDSSQNLPENEQQWNQQAPQGSQYNRGFEDITSNSQHRPTQRVYTERMTPNQAAFTNARREEPEEIISNHPSSYRMGGPADGFITFSTSDRVTNILKLTKDNSCVVTVSDTHSFKSSNRLLQSLRGTQYELLSRWKVILRAVASQQSPGTITSVVIFNDALIFNRRQVAALGLLGGMEGVEVRDIVNFTELNKKFPNIKKLALSPEIRDAAQLEFKAEPISALFNLMKNLTEIRIYPNGVDNKPKVFTRANLSDQGVAETLQRDQRVTDIKSKIDIAAAQNNPRLNQKPPQEKLDIVKKVNGARKEQYEYTKKLFKNNKWIRGSLVGTVTMLTSILQLGLMSGRKIKNTLRR